MRALFVSGCLLVLVALASADLLTMLKEVHKSPAYAKMAHDEQVLLVELIAEAEVDQLHVFIKTVHMDRIVAMLAHLPEHEASLLLGYLNKELAQEGHNNNIHTGHGQGHHGN